MPLLPAPSLPTEAQGERAPATPPRRPAATPRALPVGPVGGGGRATRSHRVVGGGRGRPALRGFGPVPLLPLGPRRGPFPGASEPTPFTSPHLPVLWGTRRPAGGGAGPSPGSRSLRSLRSASPPRELPPGPRSRGRDPRVSTGSGSGTTRGPALGWPLHAARVGVRGAARRGRGPYSPAVDDDRTRAAPVALVHFPERERDAEVTVTLAPPVAPPSPARRPDALVGDAVVPGPAGRGRPERHARPRVPLPLHTDRAVPAAARLPPRVWTRPRGRGAAPAAAPPGDPVSRPDAGIPGSCGLC